MKKILFSLLLLVMTTFALMATTTTVHAGTKKINVTMKSKDGSVIHIVGTVEYSLFPPSIDDFHGTVTITDNNGHATVLTFSSKADTNPDLTAIPNNQDACSVSAVFWSGDVDNSIMEALNSAESNSLISAQFQAGGCQ